MLYLFPHVLRKFESHFVVFCLNCTKLYWIYQAKYTPNGFVWKFIPYNPTYQKFRMISKIYSILTSRHSNNHSRFDKYWGYTPLQTKYFIQILLCGLATDAYNWRISYYFSICIKYIFIPKMSDPAYLCITLTGIFKKHSINVFLAWPVTYRFDNYTAYTACMDFLCLWSMCTIG